MPHLTSQTVESVLGIFDPNDPEYAGVRDHFTVAQLGRIDGYRLHPPTHWTFEDKLFICWAVDRAVMTSEDA